MDLFVTTVRRLSQLCGIVAALTLAAAVLVVCQMVVLRYFLNESTVWQTEFTTYSIVGATLIGSPYVLLRRGHVNVDLLPIYLPHRARLILAFVASGLALAFCVALVYSGAELWLDAWQGGWTTDSIWRLPLWIAYAPIPIGIGLLCLQYVADILCLITGREMPFGLEQGDQP
ncbi:TRAP transporter small permease [Pelagibius marinus]|uniref:TRAP transporter small permease n=1 Tax=Pelagibius marinus TaxID=2762760 RepID=UPI0018724C5E|nr:TRAP transporter small permease [Pelagibius marinus]